MCEKVYDMNVWDWAGHMTEYQTDPVWRIDIYEVDNVYFTPADQPFQIIWLNDTQAKMLRLGEENGYASGPDFWIDPGCFFDYFKGVPRKVRRYVEALA